MEQYPQLVTGPGAGRALDWENNALLFVLQASLGLMAPEIEAVSVQALPRGIVIHVLLRETNDAVDEDLSDLVFETEALVGGVVDPAVDVSVSIHVGAGDLNWPGYAHRRLYVAHERVRELADGTG